MNSALSHALGTVVSYSLGDAGGEWALAAGWATHAVANAVAQLHAELAANLSGVEVELGEGAAERVAVHAEFVGGLALVSLVLRKHFEDVAFLELANGIHIGDTGAVHLRNESVEFALQVCLACQP